MARQLKRILVPLDGSSRAEEAVPYAMTLAAAAGAQILFIFVAPLVEDWPDFSIIKSMLRAHQAGLSVAAVNEFVRFGDPMVEIVQLAEEESVDLIVMTTRGLTGKSRRELGSVASRVIMDSPVPVLAVKAKSMEEARFERHAVSQIIVPLDGVGRSPELEALAARLAVDLGVGVTIFHVRDGGPPDTAAIQGLVSALALAGAPVEYVERDGEPAHEISDFVSLDPASLVVMCRRGPSALDEDVVGSVSDFIIRHTWVPVIVVPPEVRAYKVEEEPEYLP